MKPDYQVEFNFVDEQGYSSAHVLKPGTYVLGRADDSDICFPEAALTVSRKHARLSISAEQVLIEDLESRTGTMVNGRFIRQHELESGDVITIGGFTIRAKLPEPSKVKKSTLLVPSMDSVEHDARNLEASLEELKAATDRIMAEVGKRIVGQQTILRAIWAAVLTREHCLMIGVPGLAKTLMVTTFAEALGLATNRIQFTPDLMPSDIIGSNVIQETEDGKRHFEFVQGPIFTQLLLADEINRTPPKTQSALLEAMQERQVTVGNKSLSLPSPFCVIATQNPIEQEGTYPLPEAQLDRFMLCVWLDYPSRQEELDILVRTTQSGTPAVKPVVSYQEILSFQNVAERVAIGSELANYAADLVRATRPGRADSRTSAQSWIDELVDWGAGPRAGQSLLRGAKALAAIDGRPAISRHDIREMIEPVLRHRISCNYRARTQGMDEARIIERLAAEIPLP